MIRVNLLGAKESSGRPAPAAVGEALPAERGGTMVVFVLLAVTLAGIGYFWWSIYQELGDLDQQIKFFTEEKARLQAIIAQVNEYEKKNQRLEEKERLIERLKKEREGPVHMLDEISAQLPDFIWLTSMSQSASSIAIEGMAASYVSIADFIRKLEDSAYFRNVELVDAQQDKDFTKFQLRSEIVSPQAPAAGAAPARAGSSAGSS